jgi:hypothetical protein
MKSPQVESQMEVCNDDASEENKKRDKNREIILTLRILHLVAQHTKINILFVFSRAPTARETQPHIHFEPPLAKPFC